MTDCCDFISRVLFVDSGVKIVEDRLVNLDVLSPLLVVVSSSLEVCRP